MTSPPTPRTAAGRALEDLFIACMNSARQGILPARNEDGYYTGFRAAILAIEAASHDHDPDRCDECQEMVMEALRE